MTPRFSLLACIKTSQLAAWEWLVEMRRGTIAQPRKMVNKATTLALGLVAIVVGIITDSVVCCERCTDLLFLLELRAALLSGLLLALPLLQQGLRNEDLVLRGDRSARTRISIVRVIKIAESELQLWCGILKLVIGITRRDEFNR